MKFMQISKSNISLCILYDKTGEQMVPCEWFSFTWCQLYFHAGWMLPTDVSLVDTVCW